LFKRAEVERSEGTEEIKLTIYCLYLKNSGMLVVKVVTVIRLTDFILFQIGILIMGGDLGHTRFGERKEKK